MAMSRIKLHARGPEFSRLAWGAWQALKSTTVNTPKTMAGMIEACLAQGITTFDHAALYGGYQTEALFGAALREWGGRREDIEIVTKCGPMLVSPAWPETTTKYYDTSAAHIGAMLDRSLKAMGASYVDLLLIHRPDPLMDADSTAKGLMAAVASGKARAVGVSNFNPSQVELLKSRLDIPLVTNQVEFSPLHVAPLFDGVFDQAQKLRTAPMVWSPLGNGRLFAAADERAQKVRAALLAAGRAIDSDDVAALALAWVMAHPARPIPVLGTAKPERIAVLAKADALRFGRQDWFAVLEAAQGAPAP